MTQATSLKNVIPCSAYTYLGVPFWIIGIRVVVIIFAIAGAFLKCANEVPPFQPGRLRDTWRVHSIWVIERPAVYGIVAIRGLVVEGRPCLGPTWTTLTYSLLLIYYLNVFAAILMLPYQQDRRFQSPR